MKNWASWSIPTRFHAKNDGVYCIEENCRTSIITPAIGLEASWGAAKDVLSRHVPMDECIETLLFLHQAAEDAYKIKTTRTVHRATTTKRHRC